MRILIFPEDSYVSHIFCRSFLNSNNNINHNNKSNNDNKNNNNSSKSFIYKSNYYTYLVMLIQFKKLGNSEIPSSISS